jgi:hypothetical protein
MLVRPLLGIVVLVALTFIGNNADAFADHVRHHYRPPYRASPEIAVSPARNLSHGSNDQVVAHPAGCPRTSFCGCGAAQELGLSDRSLWLVKSWYKFPRAAAASGMAVLWSDRHVAAIREVHGDGTATVYDANSGGGLTRIHRISLTGLAVVDPGVAHGEPTFASFSPDVAQTASIPVADSQGERKVVSHTHAPAARYSITHAAFRRAPFARVRAANRLRHQNEASKIQDSWHEARLGTAKGFWH